MFLGVKMSQYDQNIDRVSIGLGRTALGLAPLVLGGCQALNQMHAEVFGEETSQDFLKDLEQSFQPKSQQEVDSLAGKVMDANITKVKTGSLYENNLASVQHQGYGITVHVGKADDKYLKITASKNVSGQKCNLEVTMHKDAKYKTAKFQVNGELVEITNPSVDGLVHYALNKAFQEKGLETQVYALDPKTDRLIFGTRDRLKQMTGQEVESESSLVPQIFKDVYAGIKQDPYLSLEIEFGLAIILVATIAYFSNKKSKKMKVLP